MLKKIKTMMLAAIVPLAFAAPVLATASASADLVPSCANNVNSALNAGVNSATGSGGCSSDTSGDTKLQNIASDIVNILSWVIGIVAVIMIIFGGLKYITSGGDSSKVGSAKNTLIYAIVGLVIVALAQFIVHFVLNNVTGS